MISRSILSTKSIFARRGAFQNIYGHLSPAKTQPAGARFICHASNLRFISARDGIHTARAAGYICGELSFKSAWFQLVRYPMCPFFRSCGIVNLHCEFSIERRHFFFFFFLIQLPRPFAISTCTSLSLSSLVILLFSRRFPFPTPSLSE